MTLRTHVATRRSGPTSGPGRAPGSDGRARVRAVGTRTRRRRTAGAVASPTSVRSRGEALFPSTAPPPQAPAPPPAPPVSPAPPPPSTPPAPDPEADRERPGPQPALSHGEMAKLALRERLPLWVQSRCGLERRSLAALTVVLIVAAGGAGAYFWTGRPQQIRAPEVVAAARPLPGIQSAGIGPDAVPSAGPSPTSRPGAAAVVVVDVGGKVRSPGVFTLPAGSRVTDALRAAGGIRPGTDLTGLNRARVLMDGEQVVVGLPAAAGGGAGAGGTAGGSAAGAPGPAAPLSLNTATVEQLDALPGVGPVLARHIVEHRVEHGGFRTVAELRDVNGIGARRFADLAPLVRP
ncbi:ComEA family DNA-binding protein [Streptomyces sp. NPDC051909]|uniref:ComEA family DNA-binding protein n=1 Tax=Streptomyces sp. NPDC051909 TaxID=3154944 RepID=UPI0034241E2E